MSPASRIQNRLFGFLDEVVELDKDVRTGNSVDAGSVLTFKLDHQSFQILESQSLGEALITQTQVADSVVNDVTVKQESEQVYK